MNDIGEIIISDVARSRNANYKLESVCSIVKEVFPLFGVCSGLVRNMVRLII